MKKILAVIMVLMFLCISVGCSHTAKTVEPVKMAEPAQLQQQALSEDEILKAKVRRVCANYEQTKKNYKNPMVSNINNKVKKAFTFGNILSFAGDFALHYAIGDAFGFYDAGSIENLTDFNLLEPFAVDTSAQVVKQIVLPDAGK